MIAAPFSVALIYLGFLGIAWAKSLGERRQRAKAPVSASRHFRTRL
jgi:hypothetical protein